MRYSEALEHVAKELLDDRTEMIEGAPDHLWSDDVLLRYIGEGERRLARRAWIMEDLRTDQVTRIKLIENVTDYPIHKSIIHVKSVRLSDSEIDLIRVGYDDNRTRLSQYHADPDFWDVNLPLVENSGRPQRYSLDMGTRIIRVRRKPDAVSAALKLILSVVRMPLCPPTMDTLNDEMQVPEEYHLDICQYAAGKALQHPNVDIGRKTEGREWIREFETMLIPQAKQDRIRRQQSEPQFRFGGWGRGHQYGADR